MGLRPPIRKNYFTTRYSDDDGATYSETFSIHLSTVPVTGGLMAGGKRYLTRRTEVWSPGGATMNAELPWTEDTQKKQPEKKDAPKEKGQH